MEGFGEHYLGAAGPRVPVIKATDCLEEECFFYTGTPCQSVLRLVNAVGESAGPYHGPPIKDCRKATYAQDCRAINPPVEIGEVVEYPSSQANEQ